MNATFPRPRASVLLWAALLTAAAAAISFRGIYEPDLWWHLAQGRELAHGHLVRTNLFSFIYPDYPQPYTSWAFDLGAYLLWTRAGAAGLQAMQAILIACTLGVIARACRIRSSQAAAIAVTLFGWLMLEPRAIPRPHVASFLGLAICMLAVERARAARSWRPLAWTPAVIAVWSNVHVECVFGVAAIGIFAGGEWIRPRDLPRSDALRALGVAAACLAATAVNPYGIGLLRYLAENTLVPQVIRIAELQPPYLPNYRGFFAWAILGGILALLRWRRVAFSEATTIALFAVLGFRYLRLTPMLWIVSAALVARTIDDLSAFGVDRRAAAASALVAVLVMARVPVAGIAHEWHVGGDALEPPAFFSAQAMRFAQEHGLGGPVFTSMNLGGYVAWKLYPGARVFQDSRLQAYPAEHFRAIMNAASADAWNGEMGGVEWGVLSVPRPNELSGAGRFTAPEWGTAYRDDAIEIVVRTSGPYGKLAARF